MSCGVRARIRGKGGCRGCGRKLPQESLREWLCRGTGFCYNCARARVAMQEARPEGRAYLFVWRMAIDSHQSVAVGLKMRRYE